VSEPSERVTVVGVTDPSAWTIGTVTVSARVAPPLGVGCVWTSSGAPVAPTLPALLVMKMSRPSTLTSPIARASAVTSPVAVRRTSRHAPVVPAAIWPMTPPPLSLM